MASLPVAIIEIDIPYCDLTYGVAPCMAAIGVTGTRKCYNTIRTCQYRAAFTANPKTLRFCAPSENVNFFKNGAPVVVIPSVSSIAVTPAVLHPGVDIGQRESVRVVFADHPHSDAGLDKYLFERTFNPFDQGTFWGKLRARNPSLEGYAFRLLRGQYGQDLSQMTTYTYVIDSIIGQADSLTLVAKDVLILADQKKAQAPRISNGVLAFGLAAAGTEITLSPAGVGNAEYPVTGKISIGGKEICDFTRSSDVMTLTRAQNGTEAEEHDPDDIVQLVLVYAAAQPADIIADLLINYTPGINASWINTAEWDIEVDQYIGRLYSGVIAEPTSVIELLNELIEQVGLAFWWDAIHLQLRLQSLRPVAATARLYSDDHVIESTFKVVEQPQRRVSEVWTYYGQRNPLEALDEANNYKAAIASIDPNAAMDYPQSAIKKIFSRWISGNNRPAASRLNAMLLSRYRDPPRMLSFELFESIEEVPALGGALRVINTVLQDDTGETLAIPAQVTSLEVRDDRFIIDAQESIFVQQPLDPGDPGGGGPGNVRLIFIDDDSFNLNIRTIHDEIYFPPQSGDQIRCLVSAGATVGSNNASIPALDVGSWPVGVVLELVIYGRIQGKGGNGGSLNFTPNTTQNGGPGGTALYTRFGLAVQNLGQIYGGGGGGGTSGFLVGFGEAAGGGGGGGSGFTPGVGAQNVHSDTYGPNGQNGSKEAGGAGGYEPPVAQGGAGGNPGQPGAAGATIPGEFTPAGSGGAAGLAVDGEAYISWTSLGTIAGSRTN